MVDSGIVTPISRKWNMGKDVAGEVRRLTHGFRFNYQVYLAFEKRIVTTQLPRRS
jgi:hypothetical protein